MSSKFLLDANAFIEPRDRYYGFDLCPGYWSTLEYFNRSDRVFSIDRIRAELIPRKKEDWDDIAHWIDKQLPDTFFQKTEDKDVIDSFGKMVNWVYGEEQFTDAARKEFASVADGFLVAHAAVNGFIVVTHEEYNPDVKRRVPIPNVCEEFDVEYANTFDMLRKLGAKFINSTKRRHNRG